MPLSKTLNKTQLTVLKLCVFLQSTHIIFSILTTKQQTANAKLSEFLQSPLPPKLCPQTHSLSLLYFLNITDVWSPRPSMWSHCLFWGSSCDPVTLVTISMPLAWLTFHSPSSQLTKEMSQALFCLKFPQWYINIHSTACKVFYNLASTLPLKCLLSSSPQLPLSVPLRDHTAAPRTLVNC